MAQSAQTQRALLDAGRSEFARYGLAGARTDRIAASAGVNKQRIYAYFGNKDGLFEAVLLDTLDALLGVVPLPDPALPPGAFLARYLASVSDYHREHPELLRLLQWEALELGPAGAPSTERTAYYRDKVAAFAAGLGVSEAAAGPMLFGVLGMAAWPHMVPQLGALILGHDRSAGSGDSEGSGGSDDSNTAEGSGAAEGPGPSEGSDTRKLASDWAINAASLLAPANPDTAANPAPEELGAPA
ncbi:TetR/AcrR family transcriptional regulator [Leucobacter sp. M11]|uniref:TetR/AcrR family transcriptional regulator n=1 Tax=Leucobacter sp. M11 TaxID=2993565 RepID=UPI002D7E5520|nr:TetR/AcrR family transcriptional regulator [Leucobacter sp. M11]MEB4613687.1 TetR/AcrR family transcriptional regulator [Leucobacter sp. M11]